MTLPVQVDTIEVMSSATRVAIYWFLAAAVVISFGLMGFVLALARREKN